jgi:hypothetical protein
MSSKPQFQLAASPKRRSGYFTGRQSLYRRAASALSARCSNEGWPLSVPLGPLNAKSTRVQGSLTGVRSSWKDNGIYGSPVVLVPTNALMVTGAIAHYKPISRYLSPTRKKEIDAPTFIIKSCRR